MKRIVIIATFLVVVVIGLLVFNHSHYIEELRVKRFARVEKTRVFPENSNENVEILKEVTMDGEIFYILQEDEYIDGVFNSVTYQIIMIDRSTLGWKTFKVIWAHYDENYGYSITKGVDLTMIVGQKQENNFDTIDIELTSGVVFTAFITDSPILFYYTKEEYDIVDFTTNID